jgi:hypothetical protein
MDPHESQQIGVGNRANPDLAKQASRACVVGPNCLTTSRAALALQASQPQAGVRSCLTSTLSINESHTSSSANSSAPHDSEMELKTNNQTKSLDQSSNKSNQISGHNNQLVLGNDGRHQQPISIAEMQTMNNK